MVHAVCVYVAGIHPSRTWTSGFLGSTRWNACVHRLDLILYFHLKEVQGMESEPMLTPGEKSPLLGAQRRVEPAMLHHPGQWAQHITELLLLPGKLSKTHILALCRHNKVSILWWHYWHIPSLERILTYFTKKKTKQTTNKQANKQKTNSYAKLLSSLLCNTVKN